MAVSARRSKAKATKAARKAGELALPKGGRTGAGSRPGRENKLHETTLGVFHAECRRMIQDLGGGKLRFGKDPAHVLLAATEHLIIQMFNDASTMVQAVAGRATLKGKDILVSRKLVFGPTKRSVFEMEHADEVASKRRRRQR